MLDIPVKLVDYLSFSSISMIMCQSYFIYWNMLVTICSYFYAKGFEQDFAKTMCPSQKEN